MIEKLIAENKRRFLLQLFAEGDGDGAGDGNGSGSEGGDGGGEGSQGAVELPSFDDFLKEEGNQAEFDRRVQKAVNTAVANAQEKWKALTDDKLSEAEKLAKMNKEEKALYKAQQAEAELAALKAKMATAELEKEARTQLVIIISLAESATAISTVTIPVAGIFLIIPYSTMNVVPITLCSISESLIPRLFKRLLLIVTSPLVSYLVSYLFSYLFSYQYKQSYIRSRFLP